VNQKTLLLFSFFLGFLTPFSWINASEGVVTYALKQGLAQGSLLLNAKKVEKILKDPLAPERVKRALRLSQEVLAFAERIPMKRGAAYRSYVDLGRDWVTQVLVAAPRDKLELIPFEFPIMGAFPYKGYFQEEDAINEENILSKKYDVFRRKVPAFSSLGWFSDPLTSTLIRDEYTLIDTLLHELVHLNFYFEDESDFNEAFATWFASKATEDFIKTAKQIQNVEELKEDIQDNLNYDKVLSHFIEEVRQEGTLFYSKKSATDRESYFAWIKSCLKQYPELKSLERLEWNNATVMAFSTYTRLIPAIESYAQKHKWSYGTFLEEVKKQKLSLVKEVHALVEQKTTRRCVPSIP